MAQFAWTDDDGSVRITTCAGDVDPQEEFTKLIRIGVIPAGTIPLHDPILPQKRSQRDKWRITNGQIVVDATIPDPPNPRQALLDAIDQATTIAQLKVLLKQTVTGV